MADTPKEKVPLTITAQEVNRVVLVHTMGAMDYQRMSEEDRGALVASIRADAVQQLTKVYPEGLFTFLPPKVEAQGTGLTVAADRTLDRGVTIHCPVFVFEAAMQRAPEPKGFLWVGQEWTHTTGKRCTIRAVGVQTRMWGTTNLAEDMDTGELIPVSSDPVDWVNWTQTTPLP